MLVTDRNVSQCLERVERSDDIALDTETNGLDIWTGDRMVGVAVGAGGEKMYFPFRHGEGANLGEDRRRQFVTAASGKILRGFHLRFDIEVMHNEGMPLPPKIKDTLLGALLMNENEPCFALKRNKKGVPGLSPKYLGAASIAAEEEFAGIMAQAGVGKDELWKLPPEQVERYACADIDLPDRLMDEVYTPALDRWGQLAMFAEYNEYQRCLIDMEIGGLPIDRPVVERALLDGETARAELLAQIHRAAGYPLNPNSPKQICAWLGLPNAQEDTVLGSKHPDAQSMIDFKVYTKRDGTYLHKFLDFADPRGVLHVQLNLSRDERDAGGTKSGRLSCSRPNLQAMPKPTTNAIYSPCRQAIAAPPGFSILEADWSQAEVRVAAHYSQEPALFAMFSAGTDPYLELVAEVQPICPGFDRQDAKILHLAIQYGAGVWKVALMLGVSEAVAKKLRDAWNRRFPRIKKLMYGLQDIAKKNGCIRLFTGRYGHFDGEKKSPYCKSPFYTAWNRLVQGTVGEMARIAMLRLWPVCQQYGVRMLLQVHDSILFLVPSGVLPEFTRVVRQIMEDFPMWDVPAKVDMRAGPNWLDIKPYKEAA